MQGNVQDTHNTRGEEEAGEASGWSGRKEEGEEEKEEEEEEDRGRRLTRVCLYLRAFLSDASAAIDTLSLTQK